MDEDNISADNSAKVAGEEQTPDYRIYKERAIWAGTFLGGPLVAGYLIGENFKAFNESAKFKLTWIVAIIAAIVIFGGLFLVPDPEKIPKQIIPIVYTAIAYFLMQHYQSKNIEAHLKVGGKVYGWGRVIVISLIGLIITLIPVFGIGMLSEGKTNNDISEITKTYGELRHEITFNSNNVSSAEVDEIAAALTATVFFDSAQKKSVYVEKVGTKYILSIPCDPAVASNPDALTPFIQLRIDMQKLFSNNKIVLNLVGNSLDNILKRIE
jgi:hypothetical protein